MFLADIVQGLRRAVKTMGKIGNLRKITPTDCELIAEMRNDTAPPLERLLRVITVGLEPMSIVNHLANLEID